MLSFNSFLNEKLIILGKTAYPKFGTVVILAGGAASGKGFQINNLLGVDGKILDVDAVKLMAMKSKVFAKRVKDETGYDIANFDMKKPENVFKLHELMADVYGVTKGVERALFSSILVSDPNRKPNIIFDCTMKDMTKLESISRNVQELGYTKENIHLVWVVNDINVAMEQNSSRARVVPEEILIATHEGASLTMKKILDMGDKLKSYMDGDIWFSFNKAKVDATLVSSDLPDSAKAKKQFSGAKDKGSYVIKADYIRIKKQGQPQLSSDKLSNVLVDKIKSYVPEINKW